MATKKNDDPIKGKSLSKTPIKSPLRTTKQQMVGVSKAARKMSNKKGNPIPYKGKGEVKFNPTITGKQLPKTKAPAKPTMDQMEAVQYAGAQNNKGLKKVMAKRKQRKDDLKTSARWLVGGSAYLGATKVLDNLYLKNKK
jgi:hypothetical protein